MGGGKGILMVSDGNIFFHPLPVLYPLPDLFTWPFEYDPHPYCRLAAERLCEHLKHLPELARNEIAKGKMFGVLVVKNGEGRIGYLSAFSGQLQGTFCFDEFVPPIFNYLDKQGHFHKEEEKISQMNGQIFQMQISLEQGMAYKKYVEFQDRCIQELREMKVKMQESKQSRDSLRRMRNLSQEENLLLVRESQYQKAEYRRVKKALLEEEKGLRLIVKEEEGRITALKIERKQRSDNLQNWVFSHTLVNNAYGEKKSLREIFVETPQKNPPSGAGECCAPKLLQYAYVMGLTPVCMAEFWKGESPKKEIRKDSYFYPACQGKCGPILNYMLQGLKIEKNPRVNIKPLKIEIIYEDADIVVINKPSGLLSVPGKVNVDSVYSQLKEKKGGKDIFMVHRLDQDTSGLMVVAMTQEAYLGLQRQFVEHKVKKKYVALLQNIIPERIPKKGIIQLPLSPDYMNRPMQKVDIANGKIAVTQYEVVGDDGAGHSRIWLYPKTGRTHQLRVHCSHKDGLDNPILGDPLYGFRNRRLFLHAELLSFLHPKTLQQMSFEWKARF